MFMLGATIFYLRPCLMWPVSSIAEDMSSIYDRLCVLVVRDPGYRSRGPGFDSRGYHIF
jgi:hypothetical protein